MSRRSPHIFFDCALIAIVNEKEVLNEQVLLRPRPGMILYLCRATTTRLLCALNSLFSLLFTVLTLSHAICA